MPSNYKCVDHGVGIPGNFEALYPFNEETKNLADATGSADNDIELEERVRRMVNSVRRYEKLLFKQNRPREETKAPVKSTCASTPVPATIPDDKMVEKLRTLVH